MFSFVNRLIIARPTKCCMTVSFGVLYYLYRDWWLMDMLFELPLTRLYKFISYTITFLCFIFLGCVTFVLKMWLSTLCYCTLDNPNNLGKYCKRCSFISLLNWWSMQLCTVFCDIVASVAKRNNNKNGNLFFQF